MKGSETLKIKRWILLIAVLAFTPGCTKVYEASDSLNPFTEPGPSYSGERNSRALLEDGGSAPAEKARHALEVLGQYRRAQEPQPYYPVVQPAEVRLMWVPDHVNKAGDLVPAHYYYLRVLNDRWAVQDAFDIEEQLNSGSTGGGATPWVYKDK